MRTIKERRTEHSGTEAIEAQRQFTWPLQVFGQSLPRWRRAMLNRIASVERISACFSTRKPLGTHQRLQSQLNLRLRFSRPSHRRSLHASVISTSNASGKSNEDDITADIFTQLDTNIAEKYWPDSDAKPPRRESRRKILTQDEDAVSNTDKRSNPDGDGAYESRHKSRASFSDPSPSDRPETPQHLDPDSKFSQRRRELKDSVPYPSKNRVQDDSNTWQNVRRHKGSAPSIPPRRAMKQDEDYEPQARTPRTPYTSHLSDKSIYLRQSIVQSPNWQEFESECEAYRNSPGFDAYTLEFSRLAYLEKARMADKQRPYVEKLMALITNDIVQQIDLKKANGSADATYSGEKLDLAISLVNTHIFGVLEPMLEKMVEFIDVGGMFEPPLLPSSWRRIWTSSAYLVTQAGFATMRYSQLCIYSVAFWNHIYLNQYAYTGHHRRGGSTPDAKPIYIPNYHHHYASTKPESILNLELGVVTLGSDESPLLTGPQAVSAMLAIVSQVSGHLALKRAIISTFTYMVGQYNTFPRRRMIPLASLLLSLGEDEAANAALRAMKNESPPQADPNSAQHELHALEFLMVSNNAVALLQLAEAMSQVPAHTPSPLALTHIMWAVDQTRNYDALRAWWKHAAAIWRTLPTQKPTGKGAAPAMMLARSPLQATVSMLDLAAEHFTSDDLIEMTNDVTEIFGTPPVGGRSRVITKLAGEGRWDESLAVLTSSSPSSQTRLSPLLQDPTSSPHRTSESTALFWIMAKLIISSIQQQKFDTYIETLIHIAAAPSRSGPFLVGTLIDYISSFMPEITNQQQSEPWIPFLLWISSIPMPDGSPTPNAPQNTIYTNINKLIMKGGSDASNAPLSHVRFSARTCARFADLAGTAGLPNVVNSIIQRINCQYKMDRGETMPFSLVWLRPLVKAHAASGHADTVFQLLASLKDAMLPTEREAVWKLAFKTYIMWDNLPAAIQLFLSIRNKTIDSQIPTWSGGYTMGIQLSCAKDEYEPALQLYTLMIEDGFELRDKSLTEKLIDFLNNYLNQPDASSASNDSASPETEALREHYAALLKRLNLLVVTLEDDSRPKQKLDPAFSKKRRYAKNRLKAERSFIDDLDQTMSSYNRRSQQGPL